MQIYSSLLFKKQFKKLPFNIQETLRKKLKLLLSNPKTPSLNLKKMQGFFPDIWEIKVTKDYRVTLNIQDDVFFLRKIGTHDILRNP